MGTTSRIGLAFALVSSFVFGCSAVHTPTEVGSGIYDLSVSSERDACSPNRATGLMGPVAVVVAEDVVNVGLPDGARVSLDTSAGFHSEVATTLASCPAATLRRSWTVVGSGVHGDFDLAYHEEWQGLAGCAASAMPAEAPVADCAADLVFTYSQAQACAAPCELRQTGSTPICVCTSS